MAIVRFVDLVRPEGPKRDAGDSTQIGRVEFRQSEAEREFPRLVVASRFHMWEPGYPIPSSGIRWLIGIGTWSYYDMRLLDILNGAPDSRLETDRFDVFDFWSKCKSTTDLDRYIPGLKIETVFHTPVVGLWIDGAIHERKEGYEGRTLTLDYYSLSWD